MEQEAAVVQQAEEEGVEEGEVAAAVVVAAVGDVRVRSVMACFIILCSIIR